jgi:glycosyltransferase involved in cell wall biosynthesis
MVESSAAAERGAENPVRLLFLAWGYSIHAKRRIGLFTDDPGFVIAVASTFNYGFRNARNYLLSGSPPGSGDVPSGRSLSTPPDRERGRGRFFAKIAHRIIRQWDGETSLDDVERWIGDLKTVRAAAREFRPDVIFLQTLLYPCYLAYFLPRSIPIVVTFWNGDILWWARWNGIDRLLKKRIVRYGVRRAKEITVNSRLAVDACVEHGKPPGNIHFLPYPGTDLAMFHPSDREEARAALGIPSGKVVLCPRGLGGYLNSDVIVKSVPLVARECPDALFLFVSGVGGETEREKHKRMAIDLGVGDRCRWDGQVPWDRMPAYYRASDVVVSISSEDSLPNCMLEAMACRVPVIMGDIPPIREWVRDGSNGFLVPPRNAEMLAARILEVFGGAGGAVESFKEKNLDLVRHHADSERNGRQIKELVRRVAGRIP